MNEVTAAGNRASTIAILALALARRLDGPLASVAAGLLLARSNSGEPLRRALPVPSQ